MVVSVYLTHCTSIVSPATINAAIAGVRIIWPAPVVKSVTGMSLAPFRYTQTFEAVAGILVTA